MSLLNDILEFNKTFTEQREYEKYQTSKFPDKKMAILSCMDTRLVELLPHAMNLRNGDVKIIKSLRCACDTPIRKHHEKFTRRSVRAECR